MPFVYIVECSNGSFYTGSTRNLEKRIWEHNNGFPANFTRKRLPVKLVYSEQHESIAKAFMREKQIQGWSRKKKQALIEGKFEELLGLSRNNIRKVD